MQRTTSGLAKRFEWEVGGSAESVFDSAAFGLRQSTVTNRGNYFQNAKNLAEKNWLLYYRQRELSARQSSLVATMNLHMTQE